MFTTGIPSPRETWTISPNNRIVYTSLNQVMSEFLYGMKVFLVANGYTIKGSCDGVTGAMDAVDRWTSAAACTTRGAATTNAQSWIVLTDGNGVDILFAYQGTIDNGAKMSFSNGALFIAAGTPSNQPTATDETILVPLSTNMILVTASADRIWHGWVSSDAKMFRIIVMRQGTTACFFGVEKFISLCDPSLSIGKCYGFYFDGGQTAGTSSNALSLAATAGLRGGIMRYPGGTTNSLAGAALTLGSNSASQTMFTTSKPEAQGNTHIICGVFVAAPSGAALNGIIGLRIDLWFSYHNTSLSLGDFYGDAQAVAISPSTTTLTAGIVVPWDGTSTFGTA